MSNIEEKEVIIKEFPIHEVPLFSVIGAPGSGKSTFIEDLCYYNKHKFPVIRVWSGTEDSNGLFGKFIKPLYISNEYTKLEHEKCVVRQKQAQNDGCQNRHAIYIMDDCNTERSVFKDKLMLAQFKNGSQWWGSMFIIGSHYVFDMGPDLRKSVSYVAIFNEPSVNERKKLYETFAMNCTFTEFCDLMDQICEQYTCMIFKKRGATSNNLEDCLFYYKARLHSKWEFGCEEFKNWSDVRYNKNYKEELY